MSPMMPPPNPEYEQQVLDSIRERTGKTPACPMCGETDWRVSDPILMLLTTYPFPERQELEKCGLGKTASLVCKRCCFLTLFAWEARRQQ